MRTLCMLLAAACFSVATLAADKPRWPPEPLIEMTVPFAPTAFPGAGGTRLVYELRITNLSKEPMALRRLEVLDASHEAGLPLATYEGAQLDPVLQHFGNPAVGDRMPTADNSHRTIAAGETTLVFLTLLSDRTRIGPVLTHRLSTADSSITGARTTTAGVELLELGPPLGGGNWRAKSGAGKNDSHHRRQIYVLGGKTTLSNRNAIDWRREENGSSHRGKEDDIHSYLSYESRVLAVSDATVVFVRDGIRDNNPGHVGAEALDLSLETITGNLVVLDLGQQQYAYYAHLKPGSLRVKAGDAVKRGDVIGLVGNSGSSFEPHLHFEVTNSPAPLRGEGIPYLIDAFAVMENGAPVQHRRELPIAESLVDFR
jgi:murein DD-endopeptidase MepM/ murein hydrolase activator NlpD